MKRILKVKLVTILMTLINTDSIYSAGCCKSEGGCCNNCRKDKNNNGGGEEKAVVLKKIVPLKESRVQMV